VACLLAAVNAGNRIAASIAIIAITTSSSISVKPTLFVRIKPLATAVGLSPQLALDTSLLVF